MIRKIDKPGRVILPKPVRGRPGLQAGSDIEIGETPGGVILKPVDRRPSMIRKGLFWIHQGELPPGYDLLKAIDEDRDERIRRVWGLPFKPMSEKRLLPMPGKPRRSPKTGQ